MFLAQIMSLVLSFVHDMRWITFGMIVFTIRNIAPFFDFEQRHDVMGENAWNLIVIFQVATSIINMFLLNNIIDRGFIPLSIAFSIACYFGLLKAVYNTYNISPDENNAFATNMIFSILIMAI